MEQTQLAQAVGFTINLSHNCLVEGRMRIQLRLLTSRNDLKKGFIVFILLSTLVLVSTTQWTEARIAFAAGRTEDSDVYVMTIEGKNVQQLTHHEHDDMEPTWSPDGRQIAYSSEWEGLYGIYVMNADGSRVIGIVENLKLAVDPAWSPKPLVISPKGKLSTLWTALKNKR